MNGDGRVVEIATDDFVVRSVVDNTYVPPTSIFSGDITTPFRVMGFAPVDVMFSVGEFATFPLVNLTTDTAPETRVYPVIVTAFAEVFAMVAQTPYLLTAADPSKFTPSIARAVASLVAVPALPDTVVWAG